jgi:hypothetical protein
MDWACGSETKNSSSKAENKLVRPVISQEYASVLLVEEHGRE